MEQRPNEIFTFPRWVDELKPLLGAAALGVPVLATLLVWYGGSPATTDIGYAPEQPVPYSHALHAGELGIDCRYCHNTVEVAAHAAIPPTQTCMNCHTNIRGTSPKLAVVRESNATGMPIPWVRVHDLPDYVYFNHSIHVNKGVGCATCHGPVNKMPFMYQESSMRMEWCLECHRATEKYLRPRDQVFNMNYEQPSSAHPVLVAGTQYTDQVELGTALKSQYKVRTVEGITSCNTCHR